LYLHLGLPSGLFPSDLRAKTLYALTVCPCATCPARLIILDLSILYEDEIQLLSKRIGHAGSHSLQSMTLTWGSIPDEVIGFFN
jgi:hypothetical protein